MPANDTYWRNLKKMHVVFAVSTIGLLAVTLGMMWKDHADEWRNYQGTFERIEDARLEQQIQAEQTEQYAERVSELEERLEEARREYEENKGSLEEEITDLTLAVDQKSRQVRAQRAVRDKARADYDLAVRDDRTQAAARLKERFDEEQAQVNQLEQEQQVLETQLAEKKQEQQKAAARITALETELKAAQADVVRLKTTRDKINPDDWFASTKRKIMQWPIIDGFNSPRKVDQVWLPDLKITLGMAHTARFDRCKTCHQGIDRVETGNVPAFPHSNEPDALMDADEGMVKKWVEENKFPHPYSTHPNPDLYLSATSPHPTQEFGCTICHDGQGSATSFDNAEHTPNNPHVHAHWEEKYHYHPNHFWEYPMLPERFRESSCLKCHHSVVELETSPEFGNSAPQLVEGFHTIEQFGCYGCHEIHGQDGADSIGPDLRLEPNYYAVAQQIAAAADNSQGTGSEANGESLRNQLIELAQRVADVPEDSAEERKRLQQLVQADKGLERPLFSSRIHLLADELNDVSNPGQYRKVGPSLRHVDTKTTPGWLEYWTEDPQRFRPSTRMPKFFHLTNQEDETAEAYQPVQIAAISHYLVQKSQPVDLLTPSEDYEPDAERGRKFFAEKGCLACHSHKDFPDVEMDFGPNLDEVHAKVKPGEEGFRWVYSWIRDPQRYHKRSKMPNLFLEPYTREGQEETIDPAADIAAYLLQEREENPVSFETLDLNEYDVVLTEVGENPDAVAGVVQDATGLNDDEVARLLDSAPRTVRANLPQAEARPLEDRLERAGAQARTTSNLDRLVELFLAQNLTKRQIEELDETRKYPLPADSIKGDEIELAYEGEGQPSDEEWASMKLNYVGRRTISQYGCYGCHDVPGFEAAKPIGVGLQDWGRKDTSRLAFEHITEFLHHHNTPGEDTTLTQQVDQAMKRAKAGEFKSDEEREEGLSKAFYYDSILHHGRPGFIWQKLRQPRSYDYKKTETKRYDERLRMPKFPLNDDQIEAVATFVLGLTAEPPAERYLYKPQGATKARYDGEALLTKYNCASCHMVELPEIQYMIERFDEETPSSYADYVDMTRDQIVDWFVDNRDQLVAGEAPDYPSDVSLMEELCEMFNVGVDVPGIAKLAHVATREGDGSTRESEERYRQNLNLWFDNHPEVLLANRPATDELPDGIRKLFQLKPPQNGEMEQTTEEGDAIVRFHGLLSGPPDLESPPEEQVHSYKLWETLDVGGRISLPNRNMAILTPQLVNVSEGRGGVFAEWLVNRLWEEQRSNPQDIAARDKAWQSSPPPLHLEGLKVQTPWLYQFLKNPERIRHETVLRMPRFNMSDAEARTLANYFAAVDDAEFPYQQIPQRESSYLSRMDELYREDFAEESEDHDQYLSRSWHLLGKNALCITCHSVMGREFEAPDPTQVTHGPDLDTRVPDRLRPDWLELWLHKPKWILPYTGMPAPHTKPQEGYFGDDPSLQTQALRDALMNYNHLIQADGKIDPPPLEEAETVTP